MDFEIVNTTQSKFEQKKTGVEYSGERRGNDLPLTAQFNSKKLKNQMNKQIQLSKQNLSQKELFSNLKSFNNILAKEKQIIGK